MSAYMYVANAYALVEAALKLPSWCYNYSDFMCSVAPTGVKSKHSVFLWTHAEKLVNFILPINENLAMI